MQDRFMDDFKDIGMNPEIKLKRNRLPKPIAWI
jgi:hypothetical protein